MCFQAESAVAATEAAKDSDNAMLEQDPPHENVEHTFTISILNATDLAAIRDADDGDVAPIVIQYPFIVDNPGAMRGVSGQTHVERFRTKASHMSKTVHFHSAQKHVLHISKAQSIRDELHRCFADGVAFELWKIDATERHVALLGSATLAVEALDPLLASGTVATHTWALPLFLFEQQHGNDTASPSTSILRVRIEYQPDLRAAAEPSQATHTAADSPFEDEHAGLVTLRINRLSGLRSALKIAERQAAIEAVDELGFNVYVRAAAVAHDDTDMSSIQWASTDVVERGFCPEFDEEFVLDISPGADIVFVEVWHRPTVTRREHGTALARKLLPARAEDVLLGVARVPITRRFSGVVAEHASMRHGWYPVYSSQEPSSHSVPTTLSTSRRGTTWRVVGALEAELNGYSSLRLPELSSLVLRQSVSLRVDIEELRVPADLASTSQYRVEWVICSIRCLSSNTYLQVFFAHGCASPQRVGAASQCKGRNRHLCHELRPLLSGLHRSDY